MKLSSKKKKTQKKIKNKDMAQKLLFDLTERLHETIPFLGDMDKPFYLLAIQQLQAMMRTIMHNDEFFELYFYNKTHKEIIQWINNESKKW